MDIVIVYGIYLAAAILFFATALTVAGGALHLGSRTRNGLLIYFFAPLILVILLDPILSMRNLSFGAAALVAAGESQTAAVKWLQRLVSLFLLTSAIERITYKFYKGRAESGYGPLMLVFAACWTCCVALPAIFGTRPAFSHEYLYWLIIGLGILATSAEGAAVAIKVARTSLAIFAGAGLIVLVIKRSIVLEPYFGGLLSFFPWRYSGLAVGPNQMGPFSLLLMICLSCFPFERKWVNRLAWTAAWLSLLLAQSKTAWLAGLAAFGAIWLVRSRAHWSIWMRDRRYRLMAQCVFVLAAAVVVIGMVVVGSGVVDAKLQKFMATRAGSDIKNLTGRNEIWAAAWQAFVQSPWFGYGPTIWDPYFRFKIGLNVFHAHNQILNILASAGVIGLCSFIAFVGLLYIRVWRCIFCYNGFVAGLGTVVLLRFISEVPFTFHSFASEALMPSLLLVAVAGASAKQRSSL